MSGIGLNLDAAEARRTANRSRFFLVLSAALLALVLAGFARTFFLRPFFDVLPVPWYVYVHGSLVAAWFMLVAIQTSLVAADHTRVHRRLGIGGGALALAVVAVSLVAVLRLPARINSADVDGEGVIDFAVVVVLDLVALALFSIFVAAAIYWRRRAEFHKRLMLLASIAIVGPATGRLIPLVADIPVLPAVFVALPLVLPFVLVVHDVLANRRLHPATLGGVPLFVVLNIAGFAVANSPAGRGLIAALQ
jgi:hypothetical protein